MKKLIVVKLCVLALSLALHSQTQTPEPKIDWQTGPTVGDLGGVAQIKIPKGYAFTGKKGAQTVLELTHNLPDGTEIGALIPTAKDQNWFVIFEFDDIGFVKDEEKDKLDSAAILESIQKSTDAANETRKQKGWSSFHVVGWETPPFYDEQTHNLTWAIKGESETGKVSINRSVRLLGRRGVVRADLVLAPEEYAGTVPNFNALLGGFTFQPGSRYADFVRGDKVAEYGLSALILGGAGAVAVKSGLLGQLGKGILAVVLALKKLIIVVFAAMAAGFKKLWNWITGRKSEKVESEAPAQLEQGTPAQLEQQSSVAEPEDQARRAAG